MTFLGGASEKCKLDNLPFLDKQTHFRKSSALE